MDINNMKENKKIVIIIIIVLTITGIYCYFSINNDQSTEIFEKEDGLSNNVNQIELTKEDKNKQEENLIIVHVSGEVQEPGIVKLNEGKRIADAIEQAGGPTENADLSKLNLAYVIEDGVKIRIPKKGEEKNIGEYVSEESGDEIIQEDVEEETDKKENKTSSIVNINKANKEELMTLPGIGESTAQKIIDYRKEKGNFSKIEDIKNVSGIGDSKFNQIKKYIKTK